MRPDLEPIKIRLAAATPGPWRAHQFHDEDPDPLCHTIAEGSWDVKAGDIVICDVIDDRDRENAKLIACAPEDLAALVAHAERLEGLLTQAHDKLPEGYTVLRGQILTALGYRGCEWCGLICVGCEPAPAA